MSLDIRGTSERPRMTALVSTHTDIKFFHQDCFWAYCVQIKQLQRAHRAAANTTQQKNAGQKCKEGSTSSCLRKTCVNCEAPAHSVQGTPYTTMTCHTWSHILVTWTNLLLRKPGIWMDILILSWNLISGRWPNLEQPKRCLLQVNLSGCLPSFLQAWIAECLTRCNQSMDHGSRILSLVSSS